MMSLTGRDIVIISNEAWGDIWYSKHHYAYALSQHNRVWFIDPPAPFRPGHLLRPKVKIHRIKDRLHRISYRNVLPFTGTQDQLFRLNEKLTAGAIQNKLLARQVKNLLFWSFDPFRLVFPRQLGATTSLYHSMDFYKNRREALLMQEVDGLLSVSPDIEAKFSENSIPKLQVPHGIAAPSSSLSSLLATAPEKCMLLMGTLNERIDFKLLLRVAKAFPDYRLQLIGPVLEQHFSAEDQENVKALRALPQVEWTGTLPWRQLEPYLLKARLCLVALKQNQLGNQLNSLKVNHYLSLGRPVVSTWLKDQEPTAQQGLLYLAQSEDEFLYFCSQSLNDSDDSEIRQKRYDFAQQLAYPKLIDRIGQFIQTL